MAAVLWSASRWRSGRSAGVRDAARGPAVPRIPTPRSPDPDSQVEPGNGSGAGRPADQAPARPGDPVPPARRRRRRRILALLLALVLVPTAIGAGWYVHRWALHGVTLLARDEPAGQPFTPSLVRGGALVPTTRFDAAADRAPIGTRDGLYFDAQGAAGCDRARLETLLADDPVLASAWVAPFGIGTTGLREFVATLTPVRLRADTRATAHAWSGGRAEPYQAVLQAGSAVLLDRAGVPRVRCADGAPLTAAEPVESPRYADAWAGFDPAAVLEIRPSGTPAREFGLVDTAGEQPFRRPAGAAGATDVAAAPHTGRLDGPYVLTGAQTRCDGIVSCPALALLTLAPRFSGCPDRCVVTESNIGDDVALTRDGDSWRAGGEVPLPDSRRCAGLAVPTTFTVTFTPTASKVVDGVWTAVRLHADHEIRAQGGTPGCDDIRIAWSVNGVGP